MSDDPSNGRGDSPDVPDAISPLEVTHDPAAALIAICAAITVVCVFLAYTG